MGADDKILMAAIMGAHGVRGEVKLKSFTDPLDNITRYPLVDATGQIYEISDNAVLPKGILRIKFTHINDRDAAAALQGTQLFTARADLPPLADEDDYYHADLIGLMAYDAAGQTYGRVKAVHNFGVDDILEIGDFMLAFTKQNVPMIDLAAGRMEIQIPPTSNAEEETSDADEAETDK